MLSSLFFTKFLVLSNDSTWGSFLFQILYGAAGLYVCLGLPGVSQETRALDPSSGMRLVKVGFTKCISGPLGCR